MFIFMFDTLIICVLIVAGWVGGWIVWWVLDRQAGRQAGTYLHTSVCSVGDGLGHRPVIVKRAVIGSKAQQYF